EAREDVADGLGDDGFPGIEVVVEAAESDVGSVGDVADGGGFDALVGHDAAGGVDEAGAGLLSAALVAGWNGRGRIGEWRRNPANHQRPPSELAGCATAGGTGCVFSAQGEARSRTVSSARRS